MNRQRHTRTYRERLARRRRILAIGTLIALVAGILAQVIGATGARAHAGVVTITPANGSILAEAPRTLGVTFNETVDVTASRVQLLDTNAKIVATTFATNADRSAVTLTPVKRLPRGTYAMRWSVVSGDGHVVTGASAFLVGTRGKNGKRLTATATSTNKKTLVVATTDGVGAKTFTITGATSVAGIELRHQRLGAAIDIPVVAGNATVVIPIAGSWTVTIRERASTYVEERYTAQITFT